MEVETQGYMDIVARITRNQEGLTWPEWYAAATLGQPLPDLAVFSTYSTKFHAWIWRCVSAWKLGEDPTEYANEEIPSRF